jgi:curved DNA-binding protein CbpA
MARASRDPYEVLGVRPDDSDAELRAAYRRLVQLHHPDHNGGSAEAARRFEEVQDAYADVMRLRKSGAAEQSGGAGSRTGWAARASQTPPPPTPDPEVDARIADLERQVREARDARERAMRAAAEAAARMERRPSDEELGYVRTDDTLSKLLADARDELAQRLPGQAGQSAKSRAAELLEELAARLRGEDPKR